MILYLQLLCALLCRKLLRLYIHMYRPLVHERNHMEQLLPKDILLIDWYGKPINQIGKKVTALAIRELNCRLNVTALRSNMETISAQSLDEGTITNAEASAISQTIGHSRATARACYNIVDTNRTVRLTTSASSRLGYTNNSNDDDDDNGDSTNCNEIDTNNNNNNEVEFAYNTYEPIPWGTRHSHFGSAKTRVPFSNDELNHLQSLIIILKSNKTFSVHNVASQCFKLIMNDSDAWPIFHERHMLVPARLRPALVQLNIGVK